MKRRTKILIVAAGAAAVLAAGGATAAVAGGAVETGDSDKPITGTDLKRASEAALEHTKGGEVTETETGDEDSKYEVEVTLPNGDQVDVQLDEKFKVVNSEKESAESDDGADDDGPGDD